MKTIATDPASRSQRVRVGMIGLAAVLLLIGLAAAVFSTLNRDRPVAIAGGARPDVVANLIADNDAMPSDQPSSNPLSELGVAPSTETGNAAAAPEAHRR